MSRPSWSLGEEKAEAATEMFACSRIISEECKLDKESS